MSRKLDKTDLRILEILRKDSRTSITEIAGKVGVTRPTVTSRIEKMEEDGVIEGYTVELGDELTRGETTVYVLFDVENPEEVSAELLQREEVGEVYWGSGERNLISRARVRDLKHYKDFLNYLEGFPGRVETTLVLEKSTKKTELGVPLSEASLTCDTCGKDILDDPFTYTRHNVTHYFCCESCRKLYKEKMEKVSQ